MENTRRSLKPQSNTSALGISYKGNFLFRFPALPYRPIYFKGIQRIDQNIAPYGDITLSYQGEHPTKTDNIKLDAQFDMELQSKLLKNAYLECKYYPADIIDTVDKPDKKIIFSMYRIETAQNRMRDS